MTRTAYTLVLRFLAPLLWLWMALRARKAGGRWDILSGERFGLYKKNTGESRGNRDCIWVHAVSLGETRAAQPLIQALLASGARVLLTHTTATGRAEGRRAYAGAMAEGRLLQAWLPYDFPGSMRRFLLHFRPRLGLLIEREVWPNLLHQACRCGIPVVLVSARLSESSARQSRWLRGALKQAYGSLKMVLAQTPEDAGRLLEVGARDVRVAGNLKFDLTIPSEQIAAGRAWRAMIDRPIIAIASTREGEDEMFADLIAAERSRDAESLPLFLLIPRHPQRFDDVAALLQQHNLAYQRRSRLGQQPVAQDTRILLGDTLGELPFFYAAAEVAIVGGGFAPLGGQNLIEACAVGTPVIVGPHMFNFAQATQNAVSMGAALQVDDGAEAFSVALLLLDGDARRDAMRNAGLSWTASHSGATGRIMKALAPWLSSRE